MMLGGVARFEKDRVLSYTYLAMLRTKSCSYLWLLLQLVKSDL